ncbi:uncharacterized protein CANTADRAFT_266847 [Suhomyces tanzawaensis NRRL Y-17324]|uniref:Uncharacterized protein n=1 Tax=Suhomyces tanzawaensis NRRL Y-17324 TaxID=984487 RepID=A0A1E4SGE0_9ASCO|nr:uncharacterized protein CANTADRAFT_266847 [Suhomyces tanzawaensis NRRL Y-17324]ODV78482.1 hypothetical protein CANTADRAFT_266847 [Suhomyces tanzawaensis NRRL Y-17324]
MRKVASYKTAEQKLLSLTVYSKIVVWSPFLNLLSASICLISANLYPCYSIARTLYSTFMFCLTYIYLNLSHRVGCR